MKPRKIRHQLFLSAEDSARLARMAEATGRARSDILKEAFEAYLSRRNASSTEDGFDAALCQRASGHFGADDERHARDGRRKDDRVGHGKHRRRVDRRAVRGHEDRGR